MRAARRLAIFNGLLRRLASSAESALMPCRCVFCGRISGRDESHVCVGCYADLPWIKDGHVEPPFTTRPLEAIVAPLHYSFPIDAAIKAFKFHRKFHYQPAFSDLLLQASASLPADIDAILPVPLHRWRHMRRGFNQAVELAKPLQTHLDLPLLNNVVRIAATPYQSGLDATQRRRNLKSAFRVLGKIAAQHVLIVDDVITTGETCRQLAKVLIANGVAKVSALAVARA